MTAPAGDVQVRRCVVRVVRHGGWSWGPAARGLVDQVLRELPGLVLDRLHELGLNDVPRDRDVEITEPVRITVRMPLSALSAGPSPLWPADGNRAETGPVMSAPIPAVPASAVPASTTPASPTRAVTAGDRPLAVTAPPVAYARSLSVASPTWTPSGIPEPLRMAAGTPASSLVALLAALHGRGELTVLLGLLPGPTLVAWCWALSHRAPAHLPAADPATLGPRAATGGDHEINPLVGGPVPAGESVIAPEVVETLRRAASATVGQAAGSPGPGLPGARAVERGAGGAGRHAVLAAIVAVAEAAAGAGVEAVEAVLGHRADPASAGWPERSPGEVGSDPARRSERSSGEVGFDPARWPEPSPVEGGPALDRQARSAMSSEWGSELPAAAHPAAPGRPAPGVPTAPPGSARSRPLTVDVATALPFLLLNPLSRLGYLQAIAPVLSVAEHAPREPTRQLAAFATALAYTVLSPLERGWRRARGDVAAAARFAGVELPVPEPGLVELARVAPPSVPALDAVVATTLMGGHSAGQPLLLVGPGTRAGGGLLLADAEGLFPLAWADRLADLLPLWRASGSPVMLASPAGLPAGLPAELDAAGVRFVVDVPPNRHERWCRLPSRERLWTNDLDGELGHLVGQAAGFPDATGRLDDLVDALAVQRQAVPLAAHPALGRSLFLAAALALGTIAWTLWRTREPPDPLLALERFGDLSARVTLDDQSLEVRLPLGRRHADLLAHGLLGDVADVPWLGGRILRMSGG